jgi:phospholipid/cholesterol/gamma-HCH transport system substrate-binding protein
VNSKYLEFIVGLFVIAAAMALFLLAFNVSGLNLFNHQGYYSISMEFDNVGDLKRRAPVSVAGVTIGEVKNIVLDKDDYRAKVTVLVHQPYQIPKGSSARILTQGLLGSNYIGISPGYELDNMKPGQVITNTHSAIVLENLIGQLMFSLDSNNKNKKKSGE